MTFEDGDRVVDDLGAVRALHLTPCPQSRDAHELTSAQVRGEQLEKLRGRPRRRAGLFELDASVPARHLQLPDAGAVLHAMPERDAVPREPQVAGVHVRRDEVARGLRLAENRELEPLAGNELHLPLHGVAHLSEGTDFEAATERKRGGPEAAPLTGGASCGEDQPFFDALTARAKFVLARLSCTFVSGTNRARCAIRTSLSKM